VVFITVAPAASFTPSNPDMAGLSPARKQSTDNELTNETMAGNEASHTTRARTPFLVKQSLRSLLRKKEFSENSAFERADKNNSHENEWSWTQSADSIDNVFRIFFHIGVFCFIFI